MYRALLLALEDVQDLFRQGMKKEGLAAEIRKALGAYLQSEQAPAGLPPQGKQIRVFLDLDTAITNRLNELEASGIDPGDIARAAVAQGARAARRDRAYQTPTTGLVRQAPSPNAEPNGVQLRRPRIRR